MAQETPAPASPAELDALIDRIEDPVKREQLLADLKLLREATDEVTPAEEIAASTLPFIDEQIDHLASAALRLGEWIGRMPTVLRWARFQYENPDRLKFWIQLAVQLSVTLGIGVLVGWLARAFWHRRMPGPNAGPRRYGTFMVVKESLAILAIAVAIGLAILWFGSDPDLITLIGDIAIAILSFRAIKLATGLVFAPERPKARWLPLSDRTAEQARAWTDRSGFILTVALGLQLVAGNLSIPPLIGHVLQQIMYVVLVVTASLGLFATLPAMTNELFPEERIGLRHWLGERGPWIGTATAVVAYAIWSLGFPGGASFLIRAIGGTIAVVLLAAAMLRSLAKWDRGSQPEDVTQPAESEEPTEGEDETITGALKSRYRPFLPTLLRVVVFLTTAVALLEIWNIGLIGFLWSDAGRGVAAILMRVAIVAAITLVIAQLASYWASSYIKATDMFGQPKHNSRNRTLATYARNIFLFLLAIFAVVFVLGQVGVDATALLAGAGVVGLAIGFGSQKLVQDLINGIFILFGDTIRVGDVVDIGGQSGVVEHMSMRTVTLRSYNGNVHTIPYSSIDAITNLTKDFSYADFNIGFGYGENVDRVRDVLKDIFREMRRTRDLRREMIGDIDIAGVDALGDSAVIIKGRIKTKPGSQWMIRREFTRRVKLRFDELGIEIPFPQRTVHMIASPARRDDPDPSKA